MRRTAALSSHALNEKALVRFPHQEKPEFIQWMPGKQLWDKRNKHCSRKVQSLFENALGMVRFRLNIVDATIWGLYDLTTSSNKQCLGFKLWNGEGRLRVDLEAVEKILGRWHVLYVEYSMRDTDTLLAGMYLQRVR